jgi:hypothetical protein
MFRVFSVITGFQLDFMVVATKSKSQTLSFDQAHLSMWFANKKCVISNLQSLEFLEHVPGCRERAVGFCTKWHWVCSTLRLYTKPFRSHETHERIPKPDVRHTLIALIEGYSAWRECGNCFEPNENLLCFSV